MENKDEWIPRLRSNKLTLPLILSLMGSNVGFLLYGYMFFLITSNFMVRMHFLNLQGVEPRSFYFQFLLFLSILFVPLGGLLGVFLWGCLADRYGRKSALLISNGLGIFSSAFLCFNRIFQSFEFSLFARFFVGLGSGTFTYSVPLYILEISSLNLRGAFVTFSILFFNLGQLLIQILTSPWIWGNEENYSLLVGLPVVFSIISTICLVPSPESPRFLYLQRNDEEKARQVLKKLRGEENVEEEMEELYQEDLAESSQKNMTVWKLLCFRRLRWHLITIMVLISGTQSVETNAILIFVNQSYKALGLSARAIRLVPLAGSIIIQLMLLTTACTVESLGRRFLLWSGFLMCSISNIVLVFTLQNKSVIAAFITLILTILFFLGYISGPASVLVLIIGELFLQSSRASAYVLAGLINWGINFVSLMLFLLTNSYLGSYYLVLYWPFIILTLIYIFWMIPDTTSKTFEEIQESIEARRGPSRNSRKITAEPSFSFQN